MRSFTPEGTLAAAQKKLPHIASLGADLVYLSPIQLMSKQGGFSNPYRIADYGKIDPEYGTEADFRAFLVEAHRLHLKVLMDIVLYHTADDNVLMQWPDFYMHQDGKIVLGNWKLPRPDFSNPKLRQYFIDNLTHWVRDVGVDGFRCDVSFGVPVEFWNQARTALDAVNKDLVMLAESEKPDEMLYAFDVSYNFSHLSTLQKVFRDGSPATAVREQWETTRVKFPKGTRFLRACDNHDQQRAIVAFSERGAQAATVLNFTLDGMPFLYNGQEIGDTVATDHQSHYPIRWEIDKPEGQAGSGLAGGQKRLIEWHRKLIALRRGEKAFTKGQVVWLDNASPDSAITFVRKLGAEEIFVAVNASNRTITLPNVTPGANLFISRGTVLNGKDLTMPAFGYMVIKR
jgi:glycosidase